MLTMTLQLTPMCMLAMHLQLTPMCTLAMHLQLTPLCVWVKDFLTPRFRSPSTHTVSSYSEGSDVGCIANCVALTSGRLPRSSAKIYLL